MALFVDGPAPTIDDLVDQDAGLLDVALNTGINVSTKLRLATEEIRTDLHLWLNKLPRGTAPRIGQIVVTPPLKRWATMHALALVYRDAWFSQLVDRYQAKWREFARAARDVRETFVASGVGVVHDPIARAAIPVLGTVPGPHPGGIFYAGVGWVNAEGQEGAPSDASSIEVQDGNLMTVGVAEWPTNVVGFRVYAGTLLDAMFLQNSELLPVTATYTFVPGQITQGMLPGSGQAPDYVRPLARIWLRG
jgi:hypothetical protein